MVMIPSAMVLEICGFRQELERSFFFFSSRFGFGHLHSLLAWAVSSPRSCAVVGLGAVPELEYGDDMVERLADGPEAARIPVVSREADRVLDPLVSCCERNWESCCSAHDFDLC